MNSIKTRKGEERRKFKESKEGQRIWDRHYSLCSLHNCFQACMGLAAFFFQNGRRRGLRCLHRMMRGNPSQLHCTEGEGGIAGKKMAFERKNAPLHLERNPKEEKNSEIQPSGFPCFANKKNYYPIFRLNYLWTADGGPRMNGGPPPPPPSDASCCCHLKPARTKGKEDEEGVGGLLNTIPDAYCIASVSTQ